MNLAYYDTQQSNVVRNTLTSKLHRISVRQGVPYITHRRKTRVLYAGGVGGGAYINVHAGRVWFQ